MLVTFHTADVSFLPKHRRRLKAFIADQLKANGHQKFSIRIIFCSDEFLLDINRRFLNHDYYTDIITFPSNEGDMLEAELYISSERVVDNTKTFARTKKNEAISLPQAIDNEANRVIFHGLIHLLGFNDKTPAEKRIMTIQENKWLSKFQKYQL